jgi:hypothetical protein
MCDQKLYEQLNLDAWISNWYFHRHALGQQGCNFGTQVPLASRSLPKFGFLRVLSLYVQNESKVFS